MHYAAALLIAAVAALCQIAPAIAQEQKDSRAEKIDEAITQIVAKQPAAAIALLDPVLSSFDEQYPSRRAPLVYCANNPAGTLDNLAIAAFANKDAIALDDSWCRALWAKGFSLINLGRVAEAIAPLERAAAMMPQNPKYQSELGYAHQSLKHWDSSLAAFAAGANAAARIENERDRNVELRRAWFGMAYAEIELGHLDRAEALLTKALEVAPDDQKIRNELQYVREQRAKESGTALAGQSDQAQEFNAGREFERALREQKSNPQQAMAALDSIIMRYDDALKVVQGRVLCASDLDEANRMIAFAGYADSRQIVSVDRLFCLSLWIRGQIFFAQGNFREAERAHARVVEMSPMDIFFRADAAASYQRLGEWQKALDNYDAILRIADTEEAAKAAADRRLAWRGKGYTLLALGRLDEAEAMFSECLKADSSDKVARDGLNKVKQARLKP